MTPQLHTGDQAAFVSSLESDASCLLNECTTGVASGLATPDGRPLLWKNRDVGNSNQEFHYYDDGRIPFISITYAGEADQYYGGVNAAGFAVENSNSYNLENGPWRNGFGSGDDDGRLHTLALATCRNLDDFEALLDSLCVDGITLNSNYGAIDAFGGAAMFETGGYSFTRVDAADAPGGFLVRSNYSDSGYGLDRRSSGWGPYRRDRGDVLFRRGMEQHNLTPKYLFQQVIRDLSIDGTDPYPLPFDGYVNNSPYGVIPNGEAICRSTTRGVLVVQGVREGQRPEEAILWAMCGNPVGGTPVPLWVRAGSVPTEVDGPNTSRICNTARTIGEWAKLGGSVDTWKLVNPERTGYWDWLYGLEDWMFAKTGQFVVSRDFTYDRLEAFQNQIARQVADSLDAWKPTVGVTETLSASRVGNDMILAWTENGSLVFGNPRGYRVYRLDEPFIEGIAGVLIGQTGEREFIDRNAPARGSFYRVEAVYN